MPHEQEDHRDLQTIILEICQSLLGTPDIALQRVSDYVSQQPVGSMRYQQGLAFYNLLFTVCYFGAKCPASNTLHHYHFLFLGEQPDNNWEQKLLEKMRSCADSLAGLSPVLLDPVSKSTLNAIFALKIKSIVYDIRVLNETPIANGLLDIIFRLTGFFEVRTSIFYRMAGRGVKLQDPRLSSPITSRIPVNQPRQHPPSSNSHEISPSKTTEHHLHLQSASLAFSNGYRNTATRLLQKLLEEYQSNPSKQQLILEVTSVLQVFCFFDAIFPPNMASIIDTKNINAYHRNLTSALFPTGLHQNLDQFIEAMGHITPLSALIFAPEFRAFIRQALHQAIPFIKAEFSTLSLQNKQLGHNFKAMITSVTRIADVDLYKVLRSDMPSEEKRAPANNQNLLFHQTSRKSDSRTMKQSNNAFFSANSNSSIEPTALTLAQQLEKNNLIKSLIDFFAKNPLRSGFSTKLDFVLHKIGIKTIIEELLTLGLIKEAFGLSEDLISVSFLKLQCLKHHDLLLETQRQYFMVFFLAHFFIQKNLKILKPRQQSFIHLFCENKELVATDEEIFITQIKNYVISADGEFNDENLDTLIREIYQFYYNAPKKSHDEAALEVKHEDNKTAQYGVGYDSQVESRGYAMSTIPSTAPTYVVMNPYSTTILHHSNQYLLTPICHNIDLLIHSALP